MATDDTVTGPINLGNPGEFTVGELAEKVRGLVGGPSGVDYFPLPQDDPVRRRPDITRAKETLGWQPRVTLDEGLPMTVEYFRSALSA